MGIGGSIFLMVVGAILTFAVHASVGFVSIQVVGVILMAAGLAGLIFALYFWNSRRRTVVRERVAPRQRTVVPDDETADDAVVEERRHTVRYPDTY